MKLIIYLCVEGEAEAAELLKDFGLTEGSANDHPGQGTANRRFFFKNIFIELLYLTDTAQALSALTKPTQLGERFTSAGENVSPFGVCFRPVGTADDAPFPGWVYRPQYLPPELSVWVGDAPLSEPMWFYLSFGSRPDSAMPERRQPTTHRRGFNEVTSIEISGAVNQEHSATAVIANRVPGFKFIHSNESAMQLVFGSGAEGKRHDFRPGLPLVFRW